MIMPKFIAAAEQYLILKECQSKDWPQGYQTFFMLNSAEHEIYQAINVKMPTTIVGILTLISMIDTTSLSLKGRKVFMF